MTVNKLLLALLTLLGVSLLWLVASAFIPHGSARAAAPASVLPPSQRADAVAIARLAEISADQRLVNIAGLSEIVGTHDARELSGACVAALTRRADQLRRQPQLINQPPRTPADDTCHAAQNARLLTATSDNHINPDLRTLQHPAAAWLNSDVRSECAPWLQPSRLNLESDDNGPRLWCG